VCDPGIFPATTIYLLESRNLFVYLRLAWRNIWRNPRRTTVIMFAVIVGVWCMLVLSALTRGAETGMIQNGIATLTGHIQIYANGYRKDPVIEKNMGDPGSIKTVLEAHLPPGAHWTPRIRVEAFARNARHMAPVTLVGIDSAMEKQVSFIGKAVKKGRYIQPGDKYGIVVGQALLEQFETRIGHKLIFTSPDTDQEIASRAFYIAGIFRAELQATEKQYAFVTLPAIRHLLKLEDIITEISIVLPHHHGVRQVYDRLKAALPADRFEVVTWKERLPLLTAYLRIFDGFLLIWYLVVFIAMGFGIVNTTLMAVFERIREFGLLKALGMKPQQIIKEVLTESFILLILGLAMGDMLGFLTVFSLSAKGIDLSALAAGTEYLGFSRVVFPVIYAKDLIVSNLVVLILGLFVSMYPAAKAARFTPVEALAHT
jgi:ABC-type lipoprotein release transport system permease subunit